MGKRKPTNRTPQVKDRTETDLRRFHAALDFADLWDKWYLDVDSNGMHQWNSINRFVRSLTAPNGKPLTFEQREFLRWYLGPDEPSVMHDHWREEFKLTPVDWHSKRADGGWYSDAALRKYSETIRQKMHALEALREMGNGLVINSVGRVERMMQQVDRDFGGTLMVAGLTAQQNSDRAKLYVNLQEQLLGMLERAQDIYAKSHGINYRDMTGFEQMMAAHAMLSRGTGPAAQSNSERVLAKIVEMTLEKSGTHNIPVPEEMSKTAITLSGRKPGKPDKPIN